MGIEDRIKNIKRPVCPKCRSLDPFRKYDSTKGYLCSVCCLCLSSEDMMWVTKQEYNNFAINNTHTNLLKAWNKIIYNRLLEGSMG